jgi:polar amino acid transport system substrate-binding protein
MPQPRCCSSDDAARKGNRLRPLSARPALATTLAVAALAAMSAAQGATARPVSESASGTLTYCSSISYPPEEFYRGVVTRGREIRPKAVGSDIDIGREVAKRLDLTAAFVHREFSTIIADLLARKCDAIISGMSDTAARRTQVAFADYLVVGQSVMVRKGNPQGIRKPADLSGRSVSVERGTTDEAFLRRQSNRLQSAGKKPISIIVYSADTDAASSLREGKVDAYFGDSPVVAYYVAHDRSFAFAGRPVNPLPVGIAVRKGDSRLGRIRQAIAAMYADRTMERILARWNMSSFALKK